MNTVKPVTNSNRDMHFRSLYENAPDAILLTKPDGSILSANPAASRLFGMSEDEIKKAGRKGLLLFDKRAISALNQRDLTNSARAELTLKRKDGSTFEGEVTSSLFTDNDGTVKTSMIIRDISERKRTQDALLESQSNYRFLAENMRDVVWIMDLNKKFTYISPSVIQLTGFKPEEVKQQTLEEILTPDSLKIANETFYHFLTTGDIPVSYLELEQICKDGSTIWTEMNISVIRDKDGKPRHILGITRDINKRKKVEAELKSSEERYRTLFEQAGDYILVLEIPPGAVEVPIIYDANDYALQVHGYSREELIGKPITHLDVNISKDSILERVKMLLNKQKLTFEAEHQRKDGSKFTVEIINKCVRLGNRDFILSIERDITERKKIEAKLVQSDRIFQNSIDMICMAGFDGYFKVLNPAWSNTLGWSSEELLSKPWIEFVYSKDKEATVDAKATLVNGKEVFQFENRYICKDGRIRWLSWNSYPYPEEKIMFGVARDITEQKESHDRIKVANEKLLVTGSLTRHDVRNKLSIINANTYLLRKRIGDNSQLTKFIDEIDSAVIASNKMFEFSSTYEKIGSEPLFAIDIGEYFQQASSLLPELKKISVLNECKGVTVIADSLLRQLFYNLLDNSLKHGQKVSCIKLHFKKDGNIIKLFYEDNGVGISISNKDRLFTEGFTTGRGSGLGLKLIRKLVEAYGWSISEEGKEGTGAKFVITVPI